MSVALGIDLSLRGTGLVAVPFDWNLDWSRIARATYGVKLAAKASEKERATRIDFIARNLVEFGRKFGVTVAFVEQYAFTARGSHAHSLGELGGVLKRAVQFDLGIPLRDPIAPASARTLLGRIPRKDAKDETHIRLTQAGAPTNWTPDELDAFMIANYGLSAINGATALILEEATQPAPKRRGRAA